MYQSIIILTLCVRKLFLNSVYTYLFLSYTRIDRYCLILGSTLSKATGSHTLLICTSIWEQSCFPNLKLNIVSEVSKYNLLMLEKSEKPTSGANFWRFFHHLCKILISICSQYIVWLMASCMNTISWPNFILLFNYWLKEWHAILYNKILQ